MANRVAAEGPYAKLTKEERAHVATLTRRKEFLEKKISEWKGTQKRPDFMLAEVSSLTWAIDHAVAQCAGSRRGL